MKILLLPAEVASQIAAGEVVERPASVVKELLENALDAGAKQVTVRVEQSGKRLIEIADNGAGISAEDLPLALARHATSKLRSAADLFNIQTLGFRGEALASIASVSRLTLTSRPADAETGMRLMVEGGHALNPEPVGVPAGTLIRVEDLFYNVPARLKFLKSDTTERQQIDGLVTRYALAYPDVRFQLFQDGRAVLQSSGSGQRRELLAALYGVDTARQMLEVTLEEDGFRLTGFTSPVALTRSNRREITFFINGRWVSDTSLTAALLQAYHTLLMVGRYPLAVIFLNIDPSEVDVNVHPAKAEVRFRRPDWAFATVQRGIRRALLAYSPVPAFNPPAWGTPRSADPAWEMAGQSRQAALPSFLHNIPAEDGAAVQISPSYPENLSSGLPGGRNAASPEQTAAEPIPNPPVQTPGSLPIMRLVGQVGNTYLVAEGPDGLYLIDQHAAHERVLFERLMAARATGIPSQALLQPVVLQLPPHSAGMLSNQLDELNHLGFQVEEFGPGTFQVRAVPAFLAGGDPAAAVRVVVEDFEEDETPLQSEIEARLAARICKRVAVKGGQSLPLEEQRALLRDLEACRSPRTCPHGRPTMIHLSVDLLERQFGRRGAR